MPAYAYCPLCATALTARDHEGAQRMGCDACGFTHYDNPTPVVAAIVQRGDEVILVQNVGWPAHWFGLVSGFLERGESPEAGVVREVREELGVQAHAPRLIGAYPFEAMNQLILAYHVTISGECVAGEELAAIKVVPIAKLKPWPFGTGQAVADWLSSLSPSPA